MATFLCLASSYKGDAFLEACKRRGCYVILLAKDTLAEEDWPWDSIDEKYYMPTLTRQQDTLNAVSYLARHRKIDRIIALDDFDVETAATLREHLRIHGTGETAARSFRDKLTMREKTAAASIPVPRFCGVINYEEINHFLDEVPSPWVLKPRSQAGAMGIKKVASAEELWRIINELGDRQSHFLLEEFIPGDIFHVDSIVLEEEAVFSEVHKYKQPPLAVSHEGGVFISRTLPRDSTEVQELQELNRQVLKSLGMVKGVNHTEFIQGTSDGKFYFLEAAARVGGANISEMIESATGINLWSEWAAIEIADFHGEAYELPPSKEHYAAVMICLAKQEYPDLSQFADPEVVWKLDKKYHAGLILSSPDQTRIEALLDDYSLRFANEFLTHAPPLDEAPV